jgi:MOSC domain-containing protein YiiM
VGEDTRSKTPGACREVTLIELESIELLKREKSIAIEPEASRRNVVTRGVPLNHPVDREFQVGPYACAECGRANPALTLKVSRKQAS